MKTKKSVEMLLNIRNSILREDKSPQDHVAALDELIKVLQDEEDGFVPATEVFPDLADPAKVAKMRERASQKKENFKSPVFLSESDWIDRLIKTAVNVERDRLWSLLDRYYNPLTRSGEYPGFVQEFYTSDKV